MANEIKIQPDVQKMHYIYAALFVFLALIAVVSLFTLRSLTTDDTSTQSTTVGNATPVINAVYISNASDVSSYNSQTSPLTLVDSNTANVYVHGYATDDNGCAQITKASGTWTAKVYMSGATSGASCSANNNDCYAATELDMSESTCVNDGTNLTVSYQFTVPIYYYADATDVTAPAFSAEKWKAAVNLTDSIGSAATQVTDQNSSDFEIATLTALSVTETIGYGAMGLSDVSQTDVTTTVTNIGNDTLDVTLAGTAFSCNGINGPFPVGNAHYNYTAGQAYGSGTALTTIAVGNGSFNLAKSDNGGTATKDIYWRLSVPASGISGTCSSTVTVGACSQSEGDICT